MKTHQTHTPTLDEARDSRDQTREEVSEARQQRVQSTNPADQTVVGEIETTPAARAPEIAERARETWRAWRRRPLSRRVKLGRALFHELLQWRGELLELLVDEMGKSSLEARRELWETWNEVNDILNNAEDRLGTETDGRWWTPGSNTESSWEPRGVVMVVASGYDPLKTTVAPALAAMVAGNAVIIVGDEKSPLIVRSIANIAATMGIPDGLWTGIFGGTRLVEGLADRVDALVSYGSPSMTRRLARRQIDRMVPVLGRWNTKDVMIVLGDADLERAARAAVGGSCRGAGRQRRCIRRIYVQKSAVDSFVDAVVEEVGKLRQADRGERDGLEIGPMSDREELEEIEKLVDEASRQGARLVAGGRIRPRCRGHYYEPTVLTDVDESMGLWQRDVPGPVVAIAGVEAPAEAVRRTREIDGYGAVGIFTDNREVAGNMAGNVGAPLVGINEVVSEVPTSSPPIRGTIDGPWDPVGADRLQPLSRRVLKVEDRWGGLSEALETEAPKRVERALDAALTAVHRKGWVRKTVDTVIPGR